MTVLEIIARSPLLALSYLVPGSLILRATGLPRSLAAAFSLSASVIYVLSVGLGLAGCRLTFSLIGLSLTIVCIALAFVKLPSPPRAPASPPLPSTPSTHWLTAFLFATVALFTWRAFAQPLSGADTSFRWNYLALEIVRSGDFSYYPPVTIADFERYFYADGFAPFVALQYAWSYLVLGSTLPPLSGFVVSAQFAALLTLVCAIVASRSGRLYGLVAATILASSGLVFWTYSLGQETGWIALALVTTLWICCTTPLAENARSAFCLACAIIPALVAREYGPVFLCAGFLFALSMGARWRDLLLFMCAGAALAAPWYLHVWIRCGNPFYTLSPLGLFPTNPVIDHLLEVCHSSRALLRQSPGLLAYRTLDFVLNNPLLVVASGAALGGWRRHWAPVVVAALVTTLWFNAVGYSSGGLHLANRVLTPGLVLLVIVAAWMHTQTAATRRATTLLPPALVLACVWSVYVNAVPPFAVAPPSPAQWWTQARASFIHHPATSAIRPSMLPPQTRIVSDNAYFHAAERDSGFAHPIVPYWAPEIHFLLSPTITSADAIRQLRDLRIGAVHISRTGSPNWPYWETLPFFTTIVSTWPILETSTGLELRRVPDSP